MPDEHPGNPGQETVKKQSRNGQETVRDGQRRSETARDGQRRSRNGHVTARNGQKRSLNGHLRPTQRLSVDPKAV